MRVILLRHGIALPQDGREIQSDAARPLSPEGIRKTRRACAGLARLLDGQSVAVLSSPLVRARETAELLGEELSATTDVRLVDALAIGEDTAAVLTEPELQGGYDAIVLVGHQPSMSALASYLVAGDWSVRMGFKKSAAFCASFMGRAVPGRGEMEWFLPPKVLRGYGKGR